MLLVDRLMNLENHVPDHCAVLAAPLPPCTLIFSVSDGLARAEVLHVSGTSPRQCWREGLRRLRRRMDMRKLTGKHLRLDWVADAQSCAFSEFLSLAETTKRGYLRYGLALDAGFNVLLTEQEANAQAVYYHEDDYNSSRFNADAFSAWAAIRFKGREARLPAPDDLVWRISTAGVYCGDDGELHPLPAPRAGANLLTNGFYSGRRETQRFTPETGDATILGAARWLAGQIRKDGRFVYGWLPCFDKRLISYNCLRHASSLYSLLEALEYTGDETLKAPAERALRHMTGEFIREYAPEGRKMAFLVDVPVGEIKLGGGGVALLALAKWRDITGTDEFLPLMELLALGIGFMQDPASGALVHVLHAADLSLKERQRVIYYDGEAVFGLLRLYRETKDQRWLGMAEKSFSSFLDDAHAKAHDHWLSYAANELTLHKPEERYFRFGLNNCMGHLDFVLKRETSYPTLLELMMAAQKMLVRLEGLPEFTFLLDGVDLPKFKAAMHHRARYLLEGFFWPETAMFFQNPRRIADTFFLRHHGFRARIDDVQHFISGFIAYTRMLKEGRPEWRPE
ncbi:MAG: hypothetical protein LBI88_05260 [Deltaproteobacteria bacterium]|nr:hypothetical protein [Deltaproteobacteria bacterium]